MHNRGATKRCINVNLTLQRLPTGGPCAQTHIKFSFDARAFSSNRPQMYTQMLVHAGTSLADLQSTQHIDPELGFGPLVDAVIDVLSTIQDRGLQWRGNGPYKIEGNVSGCLQASFSGARGILTASAGNAVVEVDGGTITTNFPAVSCQVRDSSHLADIQVTCGSRGQHFVRFKDSIIPLHNNMLRQTMDRTSTNLKDADMHARKRMKNEHVLAIRNVAPIHGHADSMLSFHPIGCVWSTSVQLQKETVQFYSVYLR